MSLVLRTNLNSRYAPKIPNRLSLLPFLEVGKDEEGDKIS